VREFDIVYTKNFVSPAYFYRDLTERGGKFLELKISFPNELTTEQKEALEAYWRKNFDHGSVRLYVPVDDKEGLALDVKARIEKIVRGDKDMQIDWAVLGRPRLYYANV
jgi:hypothetical protein